VAPQTNVKPRQHYGVRFEWWRAPGAVLYWCFSKTNSHIYILHLL